MKFDAAIEALTNRARVSESWYPLDAKEMRDAVRVLEAAEKVDKAKVIGIAPTGEFIISKEVVALLGALPEEET